MKRRAFLSALVGAGSAFALDPERALWVPGRKLISIPAPQPPPHYVMYSCWDRTRAELLFRLAREPQPRDFGSVSGPSAPLSRNVSGPNALRSRICVPSDPEYASVRRDVERLFASVSPSAALDSAQTARFIEFGSYDIMPQVPHFPNLRAELL